MLGEGRGAQGKQDALYEYEHYNEAATGVPLGRVVSAVAMQRLGCAGKRSRRVARSAVSREQSHKCWHYLRMIPIFFHEHCLGLAESSVSVPGRDWTGQGSRRLVDVKD